MQRSGNGDPIFLRNQDHPRHFRPLIASDLADTRLALIVLVLSAAVLVIVIERFACMASTNSCTRSVLTGMD